MAVLYSSTIAWVLLVFFLHAANTVRAETGASRMPIVEARCNVIPNSALSSEIDDKVTGRIKLRQVARDKTIIDIALSGFDTTDSYTVHGFHIHDSNNLTVGCNSLGSHYNPRSANHGAPTANERHFGDLGNVQEVDGKVTATIEDAWVSLEIANEYSVIGRSIVIHKKEDDLGLGGDSGSLATGNAGSRLACCIINLKNGAATAPNFNAMMLSSAISVALALLLGR